MSEFEDKVVVVTGAGGGLGKSHALNLQNGRQGCGQRPRRQRRWRWRQRYGRLGGR